ncbi:MAG: hypothetical protein ACRDKH_05495 [Solirubrobacterales bacterium]
MTREEAERELEQRKQLRPELTWLIVGSEVAGWKVASVGLAPERGEAREETSESREGPPQAEDPRTVADQDGPPWIG